ncbi:GPI biosynthesis protein Pig-F [Tuber brumale]|nr:GPI biosynthesis protein Pig-F [Tuber brumale]
MPTTKTHPRRTGATSAMRPAEPHVYTAILASTFITAFPDLVSDPASTLLWTLPGLALLQAIYQVRCLRVLKPASPSGAGRKEVVGVSSKIISSFLATLFATTIGTAALYVLLVLFGAPVTTHVLPTLLCAMHASLLAVAPLVYKYRLEGKIWREILGGRAVVEECFAGAVGVLAGAWVGAVPIPLGMDREWQKWPVTIVTGAYIGYMAGKSLGWVYSGKRLPL